MTGTTDPLVGHVLDGRYEVMSRLARGGMATVYRAQDRRLGRVVAVKVMHEGLGDDAEFARKFDREARAAARLTHPNVVAVFDQGHDMGRPYIVMELVEGSTLRHLIAREAPVPPLRALELMEPVVSALAYAHEAGLVHRDVKPENVLISDRGQIKVADFGLSRAITAQTATATQGLLIGTVSYLPPELVTTGRANARSDVYSTGVVLFELLTGQKPFTGETPIQVAYAHVHQDIPAPSSLLAGNDPRSMDSRRIIPPYLDALVQAGTRRTPGERPRDARELLERLRVAKQALSHGILDDPALTQQMYPQKWADRIDATATAPIPATPAAERPLPAPAPSPVRPAFPDVTGASTPTSPLPRSPRTPIQIRPGKVYRRRRWTVGIVALLLIALMTGGGLTWWSAVGRYVSAPMLAGKTRDEAIALARAEKLDIQITDRYSETVSQGLVISADPPAGSRLLRNSQILATVSRGPERYPAPVLVGLGLDAATKALTDAHLKVGTVTGQFSETVDKGVVLAASQPPRTPLKPATPVDLTVSKGRTPITVRNMTGKPAEQARTVLQTAGFKVTMTEENSDSVPKGSVIRQSPNTGTLYRDDPVALAVSKGPVLVAVPDISIGTAEKAARDRLTAAGFQVKVVYGSPDWLRVGIASRTDPGGGKQIPKGSVVTLYVV